MLFPKLLKIVEYRNLLCGQRIALLFLKHIEHGLVRAPLRRFGRQNRDAHLLTGEVVGVGQNFLPRALLFFQWCGH